MRIALFATCIVDAMYPKVALATVRILERLGHEVVFPPGQVCCSQMHVNSGYMEDALPVVRNHVRTFMKADYDLAVAPSASCVASLGHQQPDVARSGGDEGLARDAEVVASRTLELSQLLTDVLGVTDAGAQLGSWFPHTVTYHPSCHGMRLLRLGSRQEDLLRTVAAGDGDRSLSTPLTRYYAEAGTPPGRWLGSGVTALGNGELTPGAQVSEAQLQLLVGMGRDPITGVPLGRAYPVYSSTADRVADRVNQLDPALGAVERGRRVAQIEAEEAARGSRRAVAGS